VPTPFGPAASKCRGKLIAREHPTRRSSGIGLVPEERSAQALFSQLSIIGQHDVGQAVVVQPVSVSFVVAVVGNSLTTCPRRFD